MQRMQRKMLTDTDPPFLAMDIGITYPIPLQSEAVFFSAYIDIGAIFRFFGVVLYLSSQQCPAVLKPAYTFLIGAGRFFS